MLYDRAAFIRCRLHVVAGPTSGFGDYERANDAFNTALSAYNQGLERALEQRFQASLDISRATNIGMRPLLMLFGSTARSYLNVQTPWSGYLEAGLLVRRLEQAGPVGERVFEASRRIEEAVTISRDAHLEILDALAHHVLGDHSDAVFTLDDLLANGFDGTRQPAVSDYPHDE
ncbi:hypothetical protein NMG29_03095 [Streptomyces cocklensis]|jgi:hypothetical protein|uniref:Uncharacterized protein n=1 Tax=Actinacidiphila cocklensis TaxID=887465 RepID=A0A9W4DS65_9ACTN|nr:hypothetical protein [Actinacidiphila cocklensis]MDD1057221.1 hypothetical protein [Actinacidiphila cocklensis]WSX78383.1 hypothetical protein OH826_33780 [Streptomyces sp. NBC_00899]CAG6395027.1 conserved hypothetical protein [Actinacidiphila cocklensis]